LEHGQDRLVDRFGLCFPPLAITPDGFHYGPVTGIVMAPGRLQPDRSGFLALTKSLPDPSKVRARPDRNVAELVRSVGEHVGCNCCGKLAFACDDPGIFRQVEMTNIRRFAGQFADGEVVASLRIELDLDFGAVTDHLQQVHSVAAS